MDKSLFLISVVIIFCSCSVSRLGRVHNCEASFVSVSDACVGGTKIQNDTKVKNLNLMDYLSLSGAVLGGKANVTCNVVLEITNKGDKTAGFEKFKWYAYLDDNEIADGVYKGRFRVKPSTSEKLIIPVSVDATKIVSSASPDKMKKLFNGFMKSGKLRGVKITAIPYVRILFFYVKVNKKYELSL